MTFDLILMKFCVGPADTEGDNIRDDSPETFENRWEFICCTFMNSSFAFLPSGDKSCYRNIINSTLFVNREAMIAAVPSYEELYIKVPKVLNKE